MLYVPTGRIYRDAMRTLPSHVEGNRRHEEATSIAMAKMREFNKWGVEKGRQHPQIDFFVWVDVVRLTAEEALAEFDALVREGAGGYKVVPKDLPIRLDDPRLWPIFDYCEQHELPVMTAALGEEPHDVGGQVADWMHPRHAAVPLQKFPKLKLCIAHMGLRAEETMLELRAFPNCFADISERLDYISEERGLSGLVRYIRAFSPHRVMFGTNFGSNALEVHQAAVNKFHRMSLTPSEYASLANGTWTEYRRPRQSDR